MTIRHLLVAGAAFAALCVAATRTHAHTPPHFIDLGSVKQIVCKDGVGTGEVIEPNRVLTANHVIYHAGACKVGGKPAKAIYQNPVLDIAVLEVDTGSSPTMPISCDGVQPGDVFFAVGYASGEDEVIEPLIAMPMSIAHKGDSDYPVTIKGMRAFAGNVYHGMSGGPLIDTRGRLVATISLGGGGGAGGRDLAETAVCTALKPPAPPAPAEAPPVPDTPVTTNR